MGARDALYDAITADLSTSTSNSSSSRNIFSELSGNISAVIDGISTEEVIPVDFDEEEVPPTRSSQRAKQYVSRSSSSSGTNQEDAHAPAVVDTLPNYYNANDVDVEFDQDYIANVINETNMDLYILPEDEQKKKSKIWESAYREFIEERKNKKNSQKVALASRMQASERDRKKRTRGARGRRRCRQ